MQTGLASDVRRPARPIAGRLCTSGFVLIALVASATGCADAVRAPDVLLVTIDTLRQDAIGAYGYPENVSPNLDALARRSVVFERAIAASSRTAPSHATMMTSRWVREHSIAWQNGSSRLVGSQTLAMTLKQAGYATAAFVGNVTLTRRIGLDAGFDLYDDALPNSEVNRPDSFERIASRTTIRALEWLAKRDDAQPVFLWVHFQDPHGPYTPPPPYDEMFAAREQPDEPLPALKKSRGERGIPAYQVLGDLRRPSDYRNRYAGEIRYTDFWLGSLLESFESRAREPVILVTADHGESFGEEGWYYSHGYRTTPDQTHVPFLLYAPGIDAERRSELVHHVDVMPTLLELAGLPPAVGARGLALGALVREGRPFPERRVFADVGFSLGVYEANSFVRVEAMGRIIAPGNYQMRRYAWPTGADWGEGTPDISLRELVNQYVEKKPQIARAAPIDEQTRERLRALGYLPPK